MTWQNQHPQVVTPGSICILSYIIISTIYVTCDANPEIEIWTQISSSIIFTKLVNITTILSNKVNDVITITDKHTYNYTDSELLILSCYTYEINFNSNSPISFTSPFLPGHPVLPSFINLISSSGTWSPTKSIRATGCQQPQHIQNGPINTYRLAQKNPNHQPTTKKSMNHKNRQQHFPNEPMLCRLNQLIFCLLVCHVSYLYMFCKAYSVPCVAPIWWTPIRWMTQREKKFGNAAYS